MVELEGRWSVYVLLFTVLNVEVYRVLQEPLIDLVESVCEHVDITMCLGHFRRVLVPLVLVVVAVNTVIRVEVRAIMQQTLAHQDLALTHAEDMLTVTQKTAQCQVCHLLLTQELIQVQTLFELVDSIHE